VVTYRFARRINAEDISKLLDIDSRKIVVSYIWDDVEVEFTEPLSKIQETKLNEYLRTMGFRRSQATR